MPAVKNVGEPCAGEPHARFEVAAGGNQASRLRRAAQAPPADLTGATVTTTDMVPVAIDTSLGRIVIALDRGHVDPGQRSQRAHW